MKNISRSSDRASRDRPADIDRPSPSAGEAKFAKLFAYSYDMILFLDPLGDRILDANPAACRKLGYDKSELLALSPGRLHPNEIDRFRTFVAMVLDEGSGWAGEVECVTKSGSPLPTEISASRLDLGDHPCLVLIARDLTERKRAEQDLRTLSRRVVQAQEAERRRVARELHDSVNQLLASVRFRIQSLVEASRTEGSEVGDEATRTRGLLERAIREIRRISHDLRPSELDDLGLVPAIRSLCREFADRTGLQVALTLPEHEVSVSPEGELTLYRITQEALTNIEKHASARRVELRLTGERDGLVLSISDDGKGTPTTGPTRSGLGLLDMRERAASLGGHFLFECAPSSGACVTVRLPTDPDHTERTDS